MAFASVEIESVPIAGVVRPPWKSAPYGVVSLLAMLRYSAQSFVSATFTIAQIMHILNRGESLGEERAGRLGSALGQLMRECEKLDLPMTNILLERMKADIADEKSNLKLEAIQQQMRELMSRLSDELESQTFYKVESSKAQYIDPNWLVGTPFYSQFPNARREFQRAGKCYAYGEATACAFHLHRTLEWGLKSLAVHLGKAFDRNSWEAHLKDIEKELQARYGSAGPRTADEKFYSETAAQLGHIKVAYRNPTMHIEANYDDGEGLYLLTTTEKFMQQLAAKGLKE